MHKRTALENTIRGTTNRLLLDVLLPVMRLAAQDAGYTVAIHGTVDRDIDLILVPWEDVIVSKEEIITIVIGAIRGSVGRCEYLPHNTVEKPHGRTGYILKAHCGEIEFTFDVSVLSGG